MAETDQSPDPGEREQLKHRAALGALQTFFAKYYATGVGMAYGIAMARILDPKDFGLVALAVFFLMLSTRLREFSLDEILIQKQQEDDAVYATHWTTQLCLGGFQLVLILAALPLLAHFYPDARVSNATLTGVLSVLLIGEMLTVASSTPYAVLCKRMRFGHLAILEVSGSTIGAGTGIVLALNGFGVWGLALGRATPPLFRFIYCWMLQPWKPRFAWDLTVARSFFRLGVYMWLTQTTLYVAYSTGDFLVGSMVGLVALGFFSKAVHLVTLPAEILTGLLATVSYPVYCRLQKNPREVGKALGRVLAVVFRFSLPLSMGMVLVGGEAVEVVLGRKWLPVVPLLRIMALYTVLRSIFDDTGRVFVALGKPQITAGLRAGQSVVHLAACYLLVRNFGAVGAAVSVNFGVILGVILNYVWLQKLVDIPLKRVFLRPTLCGLATLATAAAAAPAIAPMGLYARFFIKGAWCVGMYFGLLYLVDRHDLAGEFTLLKTAFALRRSRG